jgi:hypothetical protein
MISKAMRSRYRTAGAAAGLLAMVAIIMVFSSAACLFDEGGGDHHGATTHGVCASLMVVAVAPGIALVLAKLGPACVRSRWAMVTTSGALLDPPPRSILR